MNGVFYPALKTLSKSDKTGLYRLRRYIDSNSYDRLARQLSWEIRDENPAVND